MRALKAYGDKLDGAVLLAVQSESFFEQYEGLIREALDNPHARVSFQGVEQDSATTIRDVIRVSDTFGHHAVNFSHVYLTVYSWRTTPDILFDVQTIHVLSEVKKRLTGTGKYE